MYKYLDLLVKLTAILCNRNSSYENEGSHQHEVIRKSPEYEVVGDGEDKPTHSSVRDAVEIILKECSAYAHS